MKTLEWQIPLVCSPCVLNYLLPDGVGGDRITIPIRTDCIKMLLIGDSYSRSIFSCFLAHINVMVKVVGAVLKRPTQVFTPTRLNWYSSGCRREFRKTLKQSHSTRCADNPVVCLYIAARWMCLKLLNQLVLVHTGGLVLIWHTPGLLILSVLVDSVDPVVSSLSLLWSLSHTTSQHVLILSFACSSLIMFLNYFRTYRTLSHPSKREYYDTCSRGGNARLA